MQRFFAPLRMTQFNLWRLEKCSNPGARVDLGFCLIHIEGTRKLYHANYDIRQARSHPATAGTCRRNR